MAPITRREPETRAVTQEHGENHNAEAVAPVLITARHEMSR
jgi:hypothetical protein